jgi:hypothetical protein
MLTIICQIEIHTDGTGFRKKQYVSIVAAFVNRSGFIGNVTLKLANLLLVGNIGIVAQIRIEYHLYGSVCLTSSLTSVTGSQRVSMVTINSR